MPEPIRRIQITGASGLVGRALTDHLRRGGHEVVALERTATEAGPRYLPVENSDALVHLAGENIAGGRWTAAKKGRIRSSRVDLTHTLIRDLADLRQPPACLISASAVGYYGDRGEEVCAEDSPPGEGFLAEVCRGWEAAAETATTLGMRVVRLRTGLVLSAQGGGLAKMRTPFRLGIGGVLGSGRQWMSWIHRQDLVRLIAFAVARPEVDGPINAVAPEPVTNRTFTKTLGGVLHRPTLIPVPGFALKLLFGELAEALLLASTRALPQRALDLGFEFAHPDLEGALRDLL